MAAQNPGGARRGISRGSTAGMSNGGGTGNYVAPVEYLGRGGREMFVEGEDETPQFLAPDVPLGGYIFMCNEDTFARIHELMIVFGFPDSYVANPDAHPEHPKPTSFRDRVRAITPGLPLFLYNITTYRLHGVYEAAGNGGYNIEPRFFPCSHDLSRSSFPVQVQVCWRTEYQPLDELTSGDILAFQRIRGTTITDIVSS